jgi:putative ABC transport system ATP-binding protein
LFSVPRLQGPEMLIRARGLTKSYRMGAAEVHALRAVDLEVAHGEFIAIIGRSGSGKSTLLHLLGCLDHPSSGSYWLDGKAVDGLNDLELSRLRGAKIGFVFQAYNLILQHTVLENVEMPLIYSGMEKKFRLERSLEMLRRVGLEVKIAHRPTELSGGEIQRAAIARALAVNPSLVLADEPTGSLDSETSEEILKLFQELNQQGTTILLITHSRDIAVHAKRIIQMKDGRIINDSKSDSAFAETI